MISNQNSRVIFVLFLFKMVWGCLHRTSSTSSRDDETPAEKDILYSLCRSIVPIVLSPLLWKLPTINNRYSFGQSTSSSDFNGTGPPLRWQSCDDNDDDDNDDDELDRKDSHWPSYVLDGNAQLLSLLLDLLGTLLSSFPSHQVQGFLPVILYPIFEKCHEYSSVHPLVQNAALRTLQTISIATNSKSTCKSTSTSFRSRWRLVFR